MIDVEDRPRLAPGARLGEDAARGGTVLLGPERVVRLDPVAADVVRRLDGQTTIADLSATLAGIYEGDRDTITRDVLELVEALVSKGLVTR